MDDLKGFASCYAALFLTGIPFVFLIAYAIWVMLRKRSLKNTKAWPLFVNAVTYPFAFVLLLYIVAKVFGVDHEASRTISDTIRLNEEATGPPESHNSALALLFMGGFYALAVSIPTQLVAMSYSLTSTFFIASNRWRLPRWAPYALGAAVSSALITLAYVLKTPIFNWFRR